MSCCTREKKELSDLQKGLTDANLKVFEYEEKLRQQNEIIKFFEDVAAGLVGVSLSDLQQLANAKASLASAEALLSQAIRTLFSAEALERAALTRYNQVPLTAPLHVKEFYLEQWLAAQQRLFAAQAAEGAARASVNSLRSLISRLSARIPAVALGAAITYLAALAAAAYYRSQLDKYQQLAKQVGLNVKAAQAALAACEQKAGTCAKCGKCTAPADLKGCRGCGGGFCKGCFSAFIEQQELRGSKSAA